MADRSVLIVAGEVSADNLVAPLLPALKTKLPGIHFFGVGSERLEEAGLERVADSSALGVVGLFDWLGRTGEILSIYKRIREAVASRDVCAAILVDLPDFNLRLAKWLVARGIPVAYYVSPQVWAWRHKRVSTIRERVSEMFVLFPFEEEFFHKHGVPVTFVGHPIRDSIATRGPLRPQADVLAAPRLALLPGSRPTEHQRHLPLLQATLERVLRRFPKAEVRIPVPPTIDIKTVAEAFRGLPVSVVREPGAATVAWADAALVASGTATLEAALVGTPFALFYRLNPATVLAARLLYRWKDGTLGLPNWLLGRRAVSELLFGDATPEKLASTLIELVESDTARQRLVADLSQCRARLGPPGVAERTAAALGQFLSEAARSAPFVRGPVGEPRTTA